MLTNAQRIELLKLQALALKYHGRAEFLHAILPIREHIANDDGLTDSEVVRAMADDCIRLAAEIAGARVLH